ncbi:hypothetical protein PIB30_064800 [Stylosanthes scabra]|uniref:Transposase n=1 Tax=Stylosanthes scabra TaxID=79078 RepID=A0ABU6ZKH7_9FABA|nr:hypothetical protein [Stylosanthes scabra]
MWEYINEKFILPIESKQWLMQALCRAWKEYKGQIKLLHFTKYKTKKQMIRNRPLHIPEVQFRKLIQYWRLPEVKTVSEKNIENWSKQTCPHRMGSTGFAIVRKQLRDSKENNEEPSKAKIFTQMEGVCGLLTMIIQQINPGISEEDIAALIQVARNTPSDASISRPRVNTPRSSESTHFPPNGKWKWSSEIKDLQNELHIL